MGVVCSGEFGESVFKVEGIVGVNIRWEERAKVFGLGWVVDFWFFSVYFRFRGCIELFF